MSKEVDYKKQVTKAAKAKKRALIEKYKKKEEAIQEEDELKTSKSLYDKEEHIRRKLLNDMVNKDLTEDRFTRLYDKFYETYMDDESMALFMILLRLSYDYDQSNFVSLLNRVIKSIKANEAGALVKGRKGKDISNFYDTSATLELLKLVGDNPKVIEKYNKKSFLDSSGQYKIVEKFGTIEEAQRKERRLLEIMYNDAVRLANLWRKKVQEEVGEKKGKIYREEPYDEKELEEELKDEHKRFELLVELSDIISELNPDDREKNNKVFELFLDRIDEHLPRSSDNNKLFKELLEICRFYNIKELDQDIKGVLESYDDNHNSILSLLERIRKNKILQDRYAARKAIRDDMGNVIEYKNLQSNYGKLDDFIDRKKMEFLYMDKGIKYIEVKEDIQMEDDKFQIKRRLVDDELVKKIGDDLEILEGEQYKAHEQYKDTEFYPLNKDKNKDKKILKKEDKKEDREKNREKNKVDVIRHTIETLMKDFSLEQIKNVRNRGVYYLKKYFDIDSSKKIEEEIYKETNNGSLEDYLYRLGQIIILVDSNALKPLAQLLNKRLENQYYDAYELLHLSYKELLQDIYQNPLNKDFTELHNIIRIELNKFFSNFVRTLGFVDFDVPKITESYELFGPDIENIHIIQSIDSCNIEYKNKKVFEKYLEINSYYNSIDVDNVKEKLKTLKELKKEEKNIRKYIKNTVYYNEDDRLYCFNFWELEENFEKNEYNNIYTGNRFSEEFIKDFKILMESKKKRDQKNDLKIIEEDEINDDFNLKLLQENKFFRDIFDDINSREFELKNQVSKEKACYYYKNFVFPESTLEKILNKDKEILMDLKNYCGVSPDILLPTVANMGDAIYDYDFLKNISKNVPQSSSRSQSLSSPKSQSSPRSRSSPLSQSSQLSQSQSSPRSKSQSSERSQSSPRSHLSMPSITFGNSKIYKPKDKINLSIPLIPDNTQMSQKPKKVITDSSESEYDSKEDEYSAIISSKKDSEIDSKIDKKEKLLKLLKKLEPDLKE